VKRKVSCDDKFGEWGGHGMTVIFFLATNSYIDKTEGGGVCHEGDINSPNLIFRAVFTANFTADAVKCQCNNVSLQFT
jgi:hypothetical protein